MALSSISSLVLVSDVLTETKMKPWWEVVRGIFVVVMFVSASAMLPLSWTSTINCLPTFSNMTFTNPEFLYVSTVCNENVPWNNIKNMGFYVIAIALFIHFWYSWWLLVPSVKKKFQTVRKVDDSLKDLARSPKEIEELALLPHMESSDESLEENRVVIRNLSRSLWCCPNQTRVVTLYAMRNVVGIFLLLGAIAFSVCLMCVSIAQGLEYKCEIVMGENKIEVPFLGVWGVYVISLFCQFVITTCVVIYYNYRCPAPQNNECCKVKHRFNDWKFISHFSAKANDNLSEGTKKILLDRHEVVNIMKGYIAKAVEYRDFEYLNLYRGVGGEIKEIMDAVKRRILEKKVTDEDLKQFSKYCKEEGMYESFVLAHYKNFGQNSEKNDDYEDCGCNLPTDISDVSVAQKSLLHYVLKSRAETQNGEVIFNRLAIKHLLRWIIRISGEIPAVTFQPAQSSQSDIQEENETYTQVQAGNEEHIPLLEINNGEEERREDEQNDEIEMFELSLILQDCGYGNEKGITPGNRNRYNVYRAIRNLEQADQQVDFVFEDHKSFYRRMSTFWFKNKMFKEYFHLHELIYDENICPGMDEFDIHGYCGCNERNFTLDDIEPGPNGCSLLYYVLNIKNIYNVENIKDVENEAMRHTLYWTLKSKSSQDGFVFFRKDNKLCKLHYDQYVRNQCPNIRHYRMECHQKIAAKVLDFEFLRHNATNSEYIREGLVSRIEKLPVTDDDVMKITKYCAENVFYQVLVLAHYKWFGQNSEKDFDNENCGCHARKFVEGSTDRVTEKSLLYHVLQSRSRNEKGENIFNFLAVEHLLYWIRKYRVSQHEQVCLLDSEKSNVLYQEDYPEKLELSFLLNKHGYGDDVGFTNENHHHHNFYRAIRNGGEVTAEMKNFVFGDDKSFYKELSQFWLRNKFYREYVELHKLFYSFCDDLKHENIDCGCNEMTFHLTDTEPGSKGCSLLYYVLVNLDPGSEAMKHVLKWGREKQDDSENREVKVVIRGASYVDCSPMDYVNHPQNFNEPARERLIQALQEFGYEA